ncbi:MAG: DoxX family protein [Steroidobacteraceae bacterium]
MFNFDMSNGYVILRIICGLFIIPHAIGKITKHNTIVGLFTEAGFRPVKFWLYLAMATEWVLATCLILGICTQVAAAFTSVFMLVAAGTAYRLSRRWWWNLGGCEYPCFWTICAIIVTANPT